MLFAGGLEAWGRVQKGLMGFIHGQMQKKGFEGLLAYGLDRMFLTGTASVLQDSYQQCNYSDLVPGVWGPINLQNRKSPRPASANTAGPASGLRTVACGARLSTRRPDASALRGQQHTAAADAIFLLGIIFCYYVYKTQEDITTSIFVKVLRGV